MTTNGYLHDEASLPRDYTQGGGRWPAATGREGEREL